MKSALKYPANISLSEQVLVWCVECNMNFWKQWKYLACIMPILC